MSRPSLSIWILGFLFSILHCCASFQFATVHQQRHQPRSQYLPNKPKTNTHNTLLVVQHRRTIPPKIFPLNQSSSNEDSSKQKKKSRPSGVYARPSAAIERGSGFYVPGLEGSRVRGLFGTLILILTAINSNYYDSLGEKNLGSSFNVSEIVSILFSVLLILQGLVEFGKEQGFVVNLTQEEGGEDSTQKEGEGEEIDTATAIQNRGAKSVNQYVSPTILSTQEKDASSITIDNLKWSAATYLSMTPATHFILLSITSDDDDGNTYDAPEILYTLGDFNQQNVNNENNQGVSSIFETLQNSKGGRLSIPNTHPGASLLPSINQKCILVQRVVADNADEKKKYCFVVGSNQVLQAFTKNDLRWLGQLAKYVAI